MNHGQGVRGHSLPEAHIFFLLGIYVTTRAQPHPKSTEHNNSTTGLFWAVHGYKFSLLCLLLLEKWLPLQGERAHSLNF